MSANYFYVAASDPDFDGEYATLVEAVEWAQYWARKGADVSIGEWFDWRRCLTPDERVEIDAL